MRLGNGFYARSLCPMDRICLAIICAGIILPVTALALQTPDAGAPSPIICSQQERPCSTFLVPGVEAAAVNEVAQVQSAGTLVYPAEPASRRDLFGR
jgi:hypothetical protein